MVAFITRMPAGIPGAVTRSAQATIEPGIFDTVNVPIAYGVPVKMVNGKVQGIVAGDAASVVYGFLARPYPTQGGQNDPLGAATVNTSQPANILRRGYIGVQVNGAAAASKTGVIYIRVAAAAAGKPIGGIEAAADVTNTVALASTNNNTCFEGPADASGNTEIAFNL